MSRPIVLRYAGTCHDCGRALPAGSTARWFGKGRVSCCGIGLPDAQRVTPTSAGSIQSGNVTTAPGVGAPVPPLSDAASPTWRAPVDGALPPANRLAGDYSSSSLPQFAAEHPDCIVHVTLQGGHVFCATASGALHVVRCIVESCVDRPVGFKVLP